MSAYVVSDDTIHAVLTFASVNRVWLGNATPDLSMIGSILLATNTEAVNYRYEENDTAPPYRFKPTGQVPRPVQVLKLIDCIDYQCSELPDWEHTQAHHYLRMIQSAAIGALPGYDAAAWNL